MRELASLGTWACGHMEEPRDAKKVGEQQAAAGALGEEAHGACVPIPVADPGWLQPGVRLPVPVPYGCHADPQAVFGDVVFDFTRLEL